MKLISLTQNTVTQVDDADYEWLNKWKWYYHAGYVMRNITLDSGKRKTLLMHREIMQTPDNMDTDHIDGNKLNNQRHNLRICTTLQNCSNQTVGGKGTSRFMGVSWKTQTNTWVAQIVYDGKKMHLGYFDVEEDAAKAYDVAAKKYRGEFARTNAEALKLNGAVEIK